MNSTKARRSAGSPIRVNGKSLSLHWLWARPRGISLGVAAPFDAFRGSKTFRLWATPGSERARGDENQVLRASAYSARRGSAAAGGLGSSAPGWSCRDQRRPRLSHRCSRSNRRDGLRRPAPALPCRTCARGERFREGAVLGEPLEFTSHCRSGRRPARSSRGTS